jgi:hypothetical protein
MSIYGPVSTDSVLKEATTPQDVDLSLYAKKANVLPKSGGKLTGDINMSGFRVINLGELRDPIQRTDAASVGYVSNYVSYLNENKVSRAGGTMTGNLDMLNNRITSIGTPVDETNCVNKQYVDRHVHRFNVRVLGRYIIIPEDTNNTYFSVRSKRNVDFNNSKLVEIKNNLVENTSANIRTNTSITLLPNDNKDLQIMQLNSQLEIIIKPLHHLAAPWTFLFSVRPGDSPPLSNNETTILFINPINHSIPFIRTTWTSTSFKYSITHNVINFGNTTTFDLDTTQLNHIAFEYVGTKLTVWINGMSRKTHNTVLGGIFGIRMGVKELGILSLYGRELNKGEIVEHFIENHVKNFTDDEVLI